MKILQRVVQDDLEAFKMAAFMENAGAQVFAITANGTRRDTQTLREIMRYIVWAKYDDPTVPDRADAAFGSWLNSLTAQSRV